MPARYIVWHGKAQRIQEDGLWSKRFNFNFIEYTQYIVACMNTRLLHKLDIKYINGLGKTNLM